MLTDRQINKISVNYKEFAFLTEFTEKETRQIFCEYFDKDRIRQDDLIEIGKLTSTAVEPKFVRSLDPRYDGKPEIIVRIKLLHLKYKDFLSDKSCIKHKKFTGGKAIFNKILSPEQLAHAKRAFEYSHFHLFGS